MSKLNPDFIDLLEADIVKSQKGSEVITETGVVNIKPQFTETVTQESLDQHIDWMNRQGAIVHAVTSNVAHEQYAATKKTDWTGVMDLGSLQITAMHQIHDQVKGHGDQVDHIYGQCDLYFDYKHSEELTGWFDNFMAADEARCKALFEEQ